MSGLEGTSDPSVLGRIGKSKDRDDRMYRDCPHCGIGRQKRCGSGKHIMWTPCFVCADMKKFPTKIR